MLCAGMVLGSVVSPVMGSFSMIPEINVVTGPTWPAWLRGHKVKVVRLTAKDPYAMGLEQGETLKGEIRFLCGHVAKVYEACMQKQGVDARSAAKALESHIPQEYIEEMHGIADGADLDYSDVLFANTIVDIMNCFGCSVCGISQEEEVCRRAIATNFFPSLPRGTQEEFDEAFRRYDALEESRPTSDVAALKKALLAVNYCDTVQAIVFDGSLKAIDLATGQGCAARETYRHFSRQELFGEEVAEDASHTAKLARTLDWRMPLLGPLTTIVVYPARDGRASAAFVGWPGLIGALSGINEKGVMAAVSVVPSGKQAGMPNPFLIRKILEEATTADDAKKIIADTEPASAMNVVIAAPDGVLRAELDPCRKSKGAADISEGDAISSSQQVP